MAKDFSKIALGAGSLFYSTDGTTDVALGFTRGGVYNDNIVIRHIEVDGKKANVKGDAVVETGNPTLEFTLVQMEADVLDKVFANMEITDATGIKTIKRSIANIADDQYLKYVKFVGKKVDGKDISIKILNALGEGPANFTITDKGEIEIPASWTGNMETVDDTHLPSEVIIDETTT